MGIDGPVLLLIIIKDPKKQPVTLRVVITTNFGYNFLIMNLMVLDFLTIY
jgi:hypothetical protein